MSPITTHVLDTSRGRPAEGVAVLLERLAGNVWKELARGVTNADGRASSLPMPGSLEKGVYKLTFETGAYYRGLKTACFYPSVSVLFEIQDPAQHYHVPLLLSPFGYSTYRGS